MNAASGILLCAKIAGETSFQSLGRVKKSLGTKKVGHCGTLDSFAEGLLVVLAGQMTRLVETFSAFDKEYEAIVKFGSQTDTLDPTGEVVAEACPPDEAAFREACAAFRGEIWQSPPEFSAVHIGGKRASDLARNGRQVEMPKRKVRIDSLEIRDFDGGFAHLRIVCSKGTYIRSLARDIALKCGSVAHLAALRRTRIGAFSLDDAAGREFLTGDFSIGGVKNLAKTKDFSSNSCKTADFSSMDFSKHLFPLSPDLARRIGLQAAVLREDAAPKFANGKPLLRRDFLRISDGENCVFSEEGRFLGAVAFSQGKIAYKFCLAAR